MIPYGNISSGGENAGSSARNDPAYEEEQRIRNATPPPPRFETFKTTERTASEFENRLGSARQQAAQSAPEGTTARTTPASGGYLSSAQLAAKEQKLAPLRRAEEAKKEDAKFAEEARQDELTALIQGAVGEIAASKGLQLSEERIKRLAIAAILGAVPGDGDGVYSLVKTTNGLTWTVVEGSGGGGGTEEPTTDFDYILEAENKVTIRAGLVHINDVDYSVASERFDIVDTTYISIQIDTEDPPTPTLNSSTEWPISNLEFKYILLYSFEASEEETGTPTLVRRRHHGSYYRELPAWPADEVFREIAWRKIEVCDSEGNIGNMIVLGTEVFT